MNDFEHLIEEEEEEEAAEEEADSGALFMVKPGELFFCNTCELHLHGYELPCDRGDCPHSH